MIKKGQILIHIINALLFINCGNGNNNKQLNKSLSQGEFQQERIEFVSLKDTLVGYLSIPKEANHYPVVVVIHSAGQGNHDYYLYNHLKETLARINIGVFTYDRRGFGESQGNFNSASLEDLAKDALSAIDVLKRRKDIDKEKIGLYGISQGGWIAPLAYTLKPEEISYMILVSSCGVSPSEQMIYSATTTLQMNGYSEQDIEKARYVRNITDDYYRGIKDKQSTQQELDLFKSEDWFNEIYLPVNKEGSLPDNPKLTKWINEMDFRPEKYFNQIKIPIAIFYGETDRWVPIKISKEIWRESLEKADNKNSSFFDIKSAGHMMIIDEDNNPTEEIISLEYSEKIMNWLLKTVIVE